jgi:hypothetical protein
MTARLFTLDPLEDFRPKTFAGHRDAVIGAYFSSDGFNVRDLLRKNWLLLKLGLDIYHQPGWRCLRMEGKSFRLG